MSKPTYSLKWFERFGNNIQQISNGILFAQYNNCCFISPEHELINSFKINIEQESNIIKYNKFFNCWNFKGCDLWTEYNLHRHTLIKNIIFNKLKFTNKISDPLPSNHLVIHIRSGDIFLKTHKPCHKFVQSPLSFFEKIIDLYDSVDICSENFNNPVLSHLQRISKVNIYTNRTIEEDLILLLRSQNVCVGGVGTFGIAACMLSQNLKNFYSTDLDPVTFLNYNMIDPTLVNKHIVHIDQNNYIRVGSWRNSPQQRKLMIEYKV